MTTEFRNHKAALVRIGLDPRDVADWTEDEAERFLADIIRVGQHNPEDVYQKSIECPTDSVLA